MTTLRIRIDEHWPQVAGTAWVLLDERGGVLREDSGVPGQWPPADECEIILAAPQATWLRTTLPRVARAERARALAYALEDRLVREPDSQHLTVLGQPVGDVAVLAVARERLKQVLAGLEAAGRVVSRAYCELQTAPGGEGLHLTLSRDGAVLRSGDALAIALDRDPAASVPPPMLAALLERLGGDQTATRRLIVHAQAQQRPDTQVWTAQLGVEVTAGADHRWHEIGSDGVDLLHGEFAPRRRGYPWLVRLRPALVAALLLLAADAVVATAQWAWQRHVLSARNDDIARLFTSAFPKMPVVDPSAQARKQLDLARAAVGQLRSDDALALMADLSDALGADAAQSLRAAQYEDGHLEVSLVPPAGGLQVSSATLDQGLEQRDIAVTRQPLADGGVRLVLRRGVRR
jgi:general secretion pathway protein L